MNKLTKLLALVGLSAAVAYVVSEFKKTSVSNLRTSPKQPRHDDLQASSSDTMQKNLNETKKVTDYSDSRTQKMYKDLGITEEQKRRYERDYRTVMGTWEKNNPNYDMNDQDKIDEHNNLLNAVLNEDQFAMYRDWFKKNPA